MFRYTDRAYAGAASSVGRCKGFMQIQVTDVRSDKSRIRQSYLCIHVGSIHIYLSSTGVNDLADLYDFRFKDTVCRGIGDHQCGQVILIFFSFGTEVIHIYVSMFVTCTSYSGESGLDG